MIGSAGDQTLAPYSAATTPSAAAERLLELLARRRPELTDADLDAVRRRMTRGSLQAVGLR
jgi:hypothetical protein